MTDPGLPEEQIPTTKRHTHVRYDPAYVRTLSGIVKIAQMFLNLLGFICIEVSGFSYHSRGSYFIFCSTSAFFLTGILLLLYLFHIVEKCRRMPWLKIELVYCAMWAVLYLIASCLCVTLGFEAYKVAGCFGFCATIMYAADACLKLRAIYNGQVAQGELVTNEQTSTPTSPTTFRY